jgi:chromosome segregation ATPase
LSKYSRKSKKSNKSRKSRKSKKSKKSNKAKLENAIAHFDFEEIAFKIKKLEETLANAKVEYKKLVFQSDSNQDDDHIYKNKINFFANEIESKTKELLEMRKLQRKIFNANLKIDDF